MRLRDTLLHANFVASSQALTDGMLVAVADRALACHKDIQCGDVIHTQDACNNECARQNFVDWSDHVLALMLLRDCLGREMNRRGLTPPGPPMLARDWESGGMYDLVSSDSVPLPEWLLEIGRRGLAAGSLGAYTGSEGD